MRIIVVDDEAHQRELLAGFLEKSGHQVMRASDGVEAIESLKIDGAEAALVDLQMPRMDGLTFIKNALELYPDMGIVVMTAYGTVESAVKAMKMGAADFLLKPIELDHVMIILKKIESNLRLIAENRYLKRKLEQVENFEGIIGDSNGIKKVLSEIARISQSDATVLIRGESGTGKELVARAIHYASPRATGPLLAVNCTSLPETLLESELFGHERGAFTGAIARHLGRFELANNGTLFLDEIGDISQPIQAKLLRVLETHTFQRLGGEKDISVNVRILAATNRDLEAKVKDGSFREDLFYRLNVIPIIIPPLRMRKDDIIPLVEYFIAKYNKKNNKFIKALTPKASDMLLSHSWPGNVRELENVIERAIVLSQSDIIDVDDINPFSVENKESDLISDNLNLDSAEKRYIIRALQETDGSLAQAAELLGIHRNTLRIKINKYQISL